MGVHLVQLFLVFLLGLALWFLTEGVTSRAATMSRLATALFLVLYAAFDSIVGIGTGLLAQVVDADRVLDSSVAAGVVDSVAHRNHRDARVLGGERSSLP
jgi:hypothetical protein